MERERELKRKRNLSSMQQKLEALRRVDKGTPVIQVAAEMHVATSTIRHWRLQRDKIEKWCSSNAGKYRLLNRSRMQNSMHEGVEEALFIWFNQQRLLGNHVSNGVVLRYQARQFYRAMGGGEDFMASEGWLANWKLRRGIRQSVIAGFLGQFSERLQEVIKEEQLSPDQVFNCDETTLNYQMLPSKVLPATNENDGTRREKSKDHITVLACSNASGSLKLPLMVIGKSVASKADLNQDVLPIFYRRQRNAWMDCKLFEEWFTMVFVPRVSSYLKEKGLPQNALLIIDNDVSHPSVEHLKVAGVKTMILPSNGYSLIQPMEQGVLEDLKKRYRYHLLNSVLEAQHRGWEIIQHVKIIDMNDAIFWLVESWAGVAPTLIEKSWRKVWPTMTWLTMNCEEDQERPVTRNDEPSIAQFMIALRQIEGCQDVQEEDLVNWIMDDDKPAEILSDEDIIAMVMEGRQVEKDVEKGEHPAAAEESTSMEATEVCQVDEVNLQQRIKTELEVEEVQKCFSGEMEVENTLSNHSMISVMMEEEHAGTSKDNSVLDGEVITLVECLDQSIKKENETEDPLSDQQLFRMMLGTQVESEGKCASDGNVPSETTNLHQIEDCQDKRTENTQQWVKQENEVKDEVSDQDLTYTSMLDEQGEEIDDMKNSGLSDATIYTPEEAKDSAARLIQFFESQADIKPEDLLVLRRLQTKAALSNREIDSDETQNDILQYSDDSTDSSTDDCEDEDVTAFWTAPRHPIKSPHVYPFTGTASGLKVHEAPHINQNSTPLDFFQLLFQENAFQLLVNETNRYYHQHCDSSGESPPLQRDVTVDEIRLFMAITLQMEHDVRETLKDYWSTDELFHTPFYSATMKRDRYCHILRFLHFTDNTVQSNETDRMKKDRLWKIRHLFEQLNESFKKYYSPSEHLTVEEVVVPFKLKEASTHCIPTKRFGIKMYRLSDSTGYTYNMTVHLGKDEQANTENMAASHAVLAKLTEHVEGTGHKLYMNSFFSSPRLFDHLYDRKINCCGTVRCNRKGLPPHFGKNDLTLKKGDIRVRVRDNLTVMCWREKREVYMLSNMHPPPAEGKLCDKSGNALKPQMIQDYNARMSHVEMTNTYTTQIRTWKWPTKFFLHLLDLTVLNSYFLYASFKHDNTTHKSFRLKLITQLIQTSVGEPQRATVGRPSPAAKSLSRLDCRTNEHWPKQGKNRVRCRVCSARNRQKKTRISCKKCKVGLCLDPCFKLYHTRLDF